MKNYFPILPKARTEHLVISELNDETLIYCLDKHKAYCLNKTAAAVYQSADGTKSAAEIADSLSRQMKSTITEEFVLFALNELDEKNLLENFTAGRTETNRQSRREAIKRIGLSAAVALPIISMITAPTAANAQSAAACASLGQSCATASCCSGLNCDAGNVCINPALGCRPDGATCTGDGDCCGGTCSGGTCQTL